MPGEIIRPSFQRRDERGTFIEVFNGGHWEALLCGHMHAGAVMGNHYHRKTQVLFFLSSGSAVIYTIHVESGERGKVSLEAKEAVLLRTHESHAIRFMKDSEFLMLKSLRYDATDPDTFTHPVPIID